MTSFCFRCAARCGLYIVKQILDRIEYDGRLSDGDLMLVNSDGYWAFETPIRSSNGDLCYRTAAHTAERFRAALRTSDCVARLGGDEFCILVREIDTTGEAAQVAGKLIAALAEPFDLDGKTGRVGTIIGIARFPDDDGTADGLLRVADQAMYAAKAGGKTRYCFSRLETGSGFEPEIGPKGINHQ
jgi:diguanylate cyclase (GGDEF)-like protein